MKLSYELMKYVKRKAVSAISAATSPYDTIYITVRAYAYGNLHASMVFDAS